MAVGFTARFHGVSLLSDFCPTPQPAGKQTTSSLCAFDRASAHPALLGKCVFAHQESVADYVVVHSRNLTMQFASASLPTTPMLMISGRPRRTAALPKDGTMCRMRWVPGPLRTSKCFIPWCAGRTAGADKVRRPGGSHRKDERRSDQALDGRSAKADCRDHSVCGL
jgi:hypothetical protein